MEEIMISMLSEQYCRINKQLSIVNKAIVDTIDIQIMESTTPIQVDYMILYRKCLVQRRRDLYAALQEIQY